MRIVQVIDSLQAGGAERMAVNYANGLVSKIEFSGLIATRLEGDLKNQLHPKVDYLFLQKTTAIDFRAIKKLKVYCKKNQISHLHAHSSSFFLAVLVKFLFFKVKIVWHDHYGLSNFLQSRKTVVLKIASYFFDGIISVNGDLKQWAMLNLKCKKVIELKNFTSSSATFGEKTRLHGIDGQRIICVANLRPQKNHLLLLSMAKKLKVDFPTWTFHLVGHDFKDRYSAEIKTQIKQNFLTETVYFYNSVTDVEKCIEQAEIGVLTSVSEGLPLSVLEYGQLKKCVVTTNVGQISSVIQNEHSGFLIPANDENLFYQKLIFCIENNHIRREFGQNLYHFLQQNFSENRILNDYICWLNKIPW